MADTSNIYIYIYLYTVQRKNDPENFPGQVGKVGSSAKVQNVSGEANVLGATIHSCTLTSYRCDNCCWYLCPRLVYIKLMPVKHVAVASFFLVIRWFTHTYTTVNA